MSRLAVVLLALVFTSAVRAENDEWAGQFVFPRSSGVPVRDKDDKVLMKWGSTAGKVTKAEKESLLIRHNQGLGPYEGYVKKSDVVKLADAGKYFSEKIKENEKDTWALLCRGQALSHSGEYDKAIKDLDEAIRLDPKLYLAFDARGSALYAKGLYDKAIADLSEAIRLEPKYPGAWNDRGVVQYANEDYDKAIQDYTEAIRLDPGNAEPFYNRGNAWSEKLAKTTQKPFALVPRMSVISWPAAVPGMTRKSTTRRLKTSPRPSSSIQNHPRPSLAGAMPGTAKRSTRRPSRTTVKP
jgi:tetratricopeptide (TPR) repeat protein